MTETEELEELDRRSTAYHDHPGHPSDCEAYREHAGNNTRCPCESYSPEDHQPTRGVTFQQLTL